MTKTLTRDDVLRYIYKETTREEALEIEKKMLENSGLMEFYNQSKEILFLMEEIQFEPSAKIQRNILDYSSAFNFESIN